MGSTGATIKTTERKGDRLVLEIEIPKETIDKSLDVAYRTLSRRVSIPGFRPGRAPKSLVVAKIGKELLYQEAQRDILDDAFGDALAASEIRPIESEMVEPPNLVEGAPLTFKVAVKEEPVHAIERWKGIECRVPKVAVVDADVEREIESLRRRMSKLVLVTDRGAKEGDTALLDYEGVREGSKKHDIQDHGYLLELGSKQTIPGFEDAVIGLRAGETREVDLNFPTDYSGTKGLSGRAVHFRITVKELKERTLPEIDETFAKNLDHDSVEALRTAIRKRLENELVTMRRRRIKHLCLTELATRHQDVEVPKVLIEKEQDRIERDLDYNLQMRRQSLEEYLASLRISHADFRARNLPKAELQARVGLILRSLIEREKVTVSQDEVDARYKELAEDRGEEAEMFKTRIPERMIREELARQKMQDLIADEAYIVEVAEEDLREQDASLAEDNPHDYDPEHEHDENCDHDHDHSGHHHSHGA